MNPLQVLKERLQVVLNETKESEDFKQAISDGVYASNLGVTALEQWITTWISPTMHCEAFCDWYGAMDDEEKQYFNGVTFVENEWHKITGMF